MLYFAYGMNTDPQGMASRCPAARALGPARLLDHRFRFSGPADVEPDSQCKVDGVLWKITEQCLASLDLLEGYPVFYDRKTAKVEFCDQHIEAMVYFMQPGHQTSPPGQLYFATVLRGYEQFGVPTEQLWASVNFGTQILA